VTAALDRSEPADVIYLDFAKVFDTVPHERLKKKLNAHGIAGGLLRWIVAWLGNRKQRVVLNDKENPLRRATGQHAGAAAVLVVYK
jgi:alkylation response protein AidB-like acyl-CoA dehydrogenase